VPVRRLRTKDERDLVSDALSTPIGEKSAERKIVLAAARALVDIHGLKPTKTPHKHLYGNGELVAQLKVTRSGRVTIEVNLKRLGGCSGAR
jgi:hypothetical protein